MRPVIFFVGIGMVILGPLVTLSAFSSCLGTILSGNVRAWVTDIVYFVLGGRIFVAGVISAIIGVFVPEPMSTVSSGPTERSIPQQYWVKDICKKCGPGYVSSLFFCPSCGQRQG